jgi:hypothetical protein
MSITSIFLGSARTIFIDNHYYPFNSSISIPEDKFNFYYKFSPSLYDACLGVISLW